MHDDLKTPKRLLLSGVVGALIFTVGFLGGIALPSGTSQRLFASIPVVGGADPTPPEEIDLSQFWKVWNTLEEKFVPSATSTLPTVEERLWGAMEGLAKSYGDPYTTFLPPKEATIFKDDISGNFEGVGMEIGVRDGVLTVVAPLKDTPAYRAGLMPGDVILSIDETSTEGMSSDEAVQIIRGERGTAVVFSILRDGEILEISVVRDVIQIPTIDTRVEEGVFVIELYSFTAQSPRLFGEALQEFSESGTAKLILDLRGNPGGYLDAAIHMASWYLPDGEVVVTEDYGGEKDRVHRSRGFDVFNDNLEMVILIDGGSASASEILAGALQDYNIATLIGAQSFGKGSVQELVGVGESASVKVTVARWLTPNGTSISHSGLTPDIGVEYDPETDVDEQLQRALQFLNE